MAADAALLDWVSLGPARLVFRTYGWDRPTLSLGRSEPFPAGWDERALSREGIAVARRPTGGNAVLHWEEVTFALAATLPGPWRLTPRGFANEAAEALAEALRGCGVNAARVDAATPRPAPARPGEAPCFARIESGEVGAAGYKVAGLASRFSRTGALCHASVPLSARHREIVSFRSDGAQAEASLASGARSIGELLGFPSHAAGLADRLAQDLADRLAEAVAARFGVCLVEAPFSMLGLEEEPAVFTGPRARGL
ncbi:MAG: lipoate--protein ligase family protein [Candidatus Eisenbacteria bacterium]|uniref:Lipoate--protein ligase family protein n=1 Tax=Eiseniibacteriota bacterium TaxID=2212470 RepID=A0A538T844_UNCEI|nr:MAG: lipoate--protein ligase family protein [Candidatus Eisenbacteria bacterium]